MGETVKPRCGCAVDGPAGPVVVQPSLFGPARVEGWRRGGMLVAYVDRDTANDVIRRNHYSGTVTSHTTHHIGVWTVVGGFVGVLQWGYAMNPASGQSIVPDLDVSEWLELNRMWMDDRAPRNTESTAIGLAVRLLQRNVPRLRMLQSFADERCGGLGVVYQACSFGFYGGHVSDFYELDGEWYHQVLLTNSRQKDEPRAKRLAAGMDRAIKHELRQFRYLRFLDKRAEATCLLKRQPYPKRKVDQGGADLG